jgi:hypothetical protein
MVRRAISLLFSGRALNYHATYQPYFQFWAAHFSYAATYGVELINGPLGADYMENFQPRGWKCSM